jgi:hypothetical protein
MRAQELQPCSLQWHPDTGDRCMCLTPGDDDGNGGRHEEAPADDPMILTFAQ